MLSRSTAICPLQQAYICSVVTVGCGAMLQGAQDIFHSMIERAAIAATEYEKQAKQPSTAAPLSAPIDTPAATD